MSGPSRAARHHSNRRRGAVEKESDLPLVERITFYRGCLGGSEACEISSAGCRLMQHRTLPRRGCPLNITIRGRKGRLMGFAFKLAKVEKSVRTIPETIHNP